MIIAGGLVLMALGFVLDALSEASRYRGIAKATPPELKQASGRAPYDTPFDPIDDYLWQGRRSAQENVILQKTPFKHWC